MQMKEKLGTLKSAPSPHPVLLLGKMVARCALESKESPEQNEPFPQPAPIHQLKSFHHL